MPLTRMSGWVGGRGGRGCSEIETQTASQTEAEETAEKLTDRLYR